MSMNNEAAVPTDAAIWAAIILFVILVVLMVFFCCRPLYRIMQRREKHWDDPENDPRWEGETFQFSPTSPRMDRLELPVPVGGRSLPKYNRLSTSSSFSLSSSFKNHPLDRQPDAACQMPRYPDQVEIELPRKYADIFKLYTAEEGESVDTPKLYHSRSSSEENIINKIKTETAPSKSQIKKAIVKEPKVTTPLKTNVENESKNVSMKENTAAKMDFKTKPDIQTVLNKGQKNDPKISQKSLPKPDMKTVLNQKMREGIDKKENVTKPVAQVKKSTVNEGHKNEPQNSQKSLPKSIGVKNEAKPTPKPIPAKSLPKSTGIDNEIKSTPNPPKSYRKLKKSDPKASISTENSNTNSSKETKN